MSNPYTWKIATNSHLAVLQILARWKGTVYRYVAFDFLAFLIIYGLLAITYRHLMSPDIKRLFEQFCLNCQNKGHLIPIGLVLGFYVQLIVKRWWDQFLWLAWPDELAILISTYVHDNSDATKHKLKTLLRYLNLYSILSARNLSSRVKKRFPFDQNLLADGLITQDELKRLHSSTPKGRNFFDGAPIFWAGHIITELRDAGQITDDHGVELMLNRLQTYRSSVAQIVIYNMINVPLGFTQVVTLTVYSYYISSIFAWQFLDASQKYDHCRVDLYIPVFGLLRLIFYMGWLKVAEALLNPLGDDVDDLQLDKFIQRNIWISNFIIDKLHEEAPLLCRGVMVQTLPVDEVGLQPPGIPSNRRLSLKGDRLFLGRLNEPFNLSPS